MLAPLQTLVERYLHLEDREIFSVILGAMGAFRLGLDLVWLLVIGPPSGAKTELVTMLSKCPEYFALSELTENTLSSGFDGEEKEGAPPPPDPSLLNHLDGKMLVFKDFTTVLDMRSEPKRAVLAQLREVYDGAFDEVWGTGKQIHWKGRVGFIAGVTEAIDKEHMAMALLGPRFVLARLRPQAREAVSHRAMTNALSQVTDGQKALIAQQVAKYLAGLPLAAPGVDLADFRPFMRLADLVTRARSITVRDSYSRELSNTPEPESPARFVKQILALARGMAWVRGRAKVGPHELSSIGRVSLDAIPVARRRVLERLALEEGPVHEAELVRMIPTSETTSRRALEDLTALGVCEKGPLGFAIRSEYRGLMVGP